jgi:hypothetical protein
MNTGKHNPDFELDYQKTTWTEKQHEAHAIEIYKKDFFALLKGYSHLSNWDEEVMTTMEVSDDLGADAIIEFQPFFYSKTSINPLTRVLEVDTIKEPEIELWDIYYTRAYSDSATLQYDDFNNTELEEIKNIIRTHCE